MKRRLLTSLLFGIFVTVVYVCIHQYLVEKKKKSGQFELEKARHPQRYNVDLLLRAEEDSTKKITIDDLRLIKDKLKKKAAFLDQDAIVSQPDDNSFQIDLSGIRDTAGLEDFFTKAYSVQFWEMYASVDLIDFLKALNEKNSDLISPVTNVYTDDSSGFAELGYLDPKDSAAVRRIVSESSLQLLLPKDALLIFGKAGYGEKFALYAIKTRGFSTGPVSEEDIRDARQEYTKNAQIEVRIEFNKIGTKKWYMLTSMNAKKYLGIAVNHFILSAPRVTEPIKEGIAFVTGSFGIEEAAALALQLKMGKLPCSLRLVKKEITAIKPPILYRLKDLLIPLLILILFTVLGYHLLALIKLPENSTL